MFQLDLLSQSEFEMFCNALNEHKHGSDKSIRKLFACFTGLEKRMDQLEGKVKIAKKRGRKRKISVQFDLFEERKAV